MLRVYLFVMMTLIIYLFILITSVSSYPLATNNGCSIDISKDFTYQHPLILYTNKNEFILPNIKNGISFTKGQSVRLSCPGQNNHIQISTVNETTITCVSNKTFTVNDNKSGKRNFKELCCSKYPEPTAIRTGKKCSKMYTEIQIGFRTNKGFVSIMTNCLDEIKKDTLYSIYNLTSKINNEQYVPRPNSFIEGNFYEDIYPKPTTLYEKKSQRTALERLLKSTDLAAKYISFVNEYYLSRGHLTAKADFVYGSQQRATFFYVNVAPQWQTFNGGNWNEAERSCRNYVNKRNLNLTVYTGIYGQSTLPDINNNHRNISLYVDKNYKQLLTVPEIFWKVLHDPISKKAVALIGHNNPYNKNVTFICNDVSNKLNWLSWDAKNVTSGISYSCNFTDFKKVVHYMPNIQVNGLLT